MCLRAGVLPLSYSSFVPSMNCWSPIGTANLLVCPRVLDIPEQLVLSCKSGDRSQRWLLPPGIVQLELLPLDFACLMTPATNVGTSCPAGRSE